MSAFGTKRTSNCRPAMSTFGGKADIMKNENPVAGRNSSPGVADYQVPSTLAAQATNEMPGAKDLDRYLWGAAFIIMTVWLLIKLFGKTLIGMK